MVIAHDGTTKWTTITDRQQMEHHLIENNKIHFVQAEETSPTVEPLATLLGDGTNQTCKKIWMVAMKYQITFHALSKIIQQT